MPTQRKDGRENVKRHQIRLALLPMLPAGAVAAGVATALSASGSSVAAPAPSQGAGAPQQCKPGTPLPDAHARPRWSAEALPLRLVLKRILYLLAILLLPGALIAVPVLWWLKRRRIRPARPSED